MVSYAISGVSLRSGRVCVMENLEKSLLQYIQEHALMHANERLLVACSGGVDSMVLLHLLHQYEAQLQVTIGAAHVDHMLRGAQSAADGDLVRTFCKERHIPFYSGAVAVPEKLQQKNGNVQQICREGRYQYLAEVMDKEGYDVLVTAHHGEDQLETLLMQLTKGRSLLGMPIQRTFHKQRLVRPLLFADKTMLYRYAEWHYIPFREDPSNRTHDYMRNRFRHTIIPKLLDENESLVYAVAKVAQDAQEDERYLQKLTESWLQDHLQWTDDGYPMMCIESFRRMDSALQRRAIPLLLNYLYDQKHPVFYKSDMIDQILQHIQRNEGNVSIDLPDDFQFIREYHLFLFRKKNETQLAEKHLPKGQFVAWGEELWLYWDEIEQVQQEVLSEAKEITFFHIDENALPLSVRTRRDGDRMFIKGLNRKKKVSRMMIDEKVGRTVREQLPLIVTNDGEVIAIPTLRYGCHFTMEKTKNREYIFIVGRQ